MSVRAALIVASLVFATACGSSSTPTTPSPPPSSPPPSPSPSPSPTPNPSPTGSSVSIVAGASVLTTTAFNPNPLTIATGTTVTWMNDDSVAHTSTSDNSAWNSGSISPGASFAFTFSSAGSFTYHCAIHPGMVASITVQ